MPQTDVERFWSYVDKSGECWIWTGYRDDEGYGRFGVNGGQVKAHRFAWEQEHGPIPPGKDVCHDCPGGDNPACVRHLFLGTRAENNADRAAKGRYYRADGTASCGAPKLTPAQVREIRARYVPRKVTTYQLAREYGVNQSLVWKIVQGHAWKGVA